MVEAIARRVVELLEMLPERTAVRLIDAAAVADLLGVERDWVYAHANELGAVRLGGPRGRLRFDMAVIKKRLDREPDQGQRHRPAPGSIRARGADKEAPRPRLKSRPTGKGRGGAVTPAPDRYNTNTGR